MGYETYYSLEYARDKFTTREQIDLWCKHNNLPVRPSASEDWARWYEWRNDLERLSRRFPFTAFKLTGDGEDEYDLWIAYALNGEVTHEIVEIIMRYPDPPDYWEERFCPKCRSAWITHNGDGSCVEDW